MRTTLLLLTVLGLAACGQTGALYLPEQGAKHKKPAKTAPLSSAPAPAGTPPQTPPPASTPAP